MDELLTLTPTRLVLLAGLPGTGKSTLAAALASRLPSAIVLSKDEIRAAMFHGAAADYSEAQNALAMNALLAAADYLCAQSSRPQYLLIDGRTFSHAGHIEQVIQFARDHHASWSILHLWCPDLVAFDRLKASQADHPAHNRGRELYTCLQSSFEPIKQPHLTLDTNLPLQDSVKAALEYLRP